MVITDIKPQVKDPLRENIYLDGKFGFGISAEARFDNKLKIGQVISETKIKELVFQDQVGKLLLSAQRFLSFRPRSEKEIRDHLKRKLEKSDFTEPEKILDSVIIKLQKYGLVNDEEFATWWVQQRQKFRPRGERILRSELHAKGIDRNIIDEQLRAYDSPAGEIAKVAQKKLASFSKLPPLQFRRKMGEYLARRGYDWDEIKTVVNNLSQEKD